MQTSLLHKKRGKRKKNLPINSYDTSFLKSQKYCTVAFWSGFESSSSTIGSWALWIVRRTGAQVGLVGERCCFPEFGMFPWTSRAIILRGSLSTSAHNHTHTHTHTNSFQTTLINSFPTYNTSAHAHTHNHPLLRVCLFVQAPSLSMHGILADIEADKVLRRV